MCVLPVQAKWIAAGVAGFLFRQHGPQVIAVSGAEVQHEVIEHHPRYFPAVFYSHKGFAVGNGNFPVFVSRSGQHLASGFIERHLVFLAFPVEAERHACRNACGGVDRKVVYIVGITNLLTERIDKEAGKPFSDLDVQVVAVHPNLYFSDVDGVFAAVDHHLGAVVRVFLHITQLHRHRFVACEVIRAVDEDLQVAFAGIAGQQAQVAGEAAVGVGRDIGIGPAGLDSSTGSCPACSFYLR